MPPCDDLAFVRFALEEVLSAGVDDGFPCCPGLIFTGVSFSSAVGTVSLNNCKIAFSSYFFFLSLLLLLLLLQSYPSLVSTSTSFCSSSSGSKIISRSLHTYRYSINEL